MRSAWPLALSLAGCGDLPLADAGGSTTSSSSSTTADEPTTTDSDALPTTSSATSPTASTDASSTTSTTTASETADGTCTGADVACTGGQAWLRAFPVSGDGFWGHPVDAAALAVAPNGDIVATGLYGGTITFGDEMIASIGALDVWVARFAPDGEPIWFRRFGGPDPTPDGGYGGANWSAGNITFDPGGDILLTAKCIDTIDFGFGPLAGEDLDPVVLRLSSTGEPKWAHRHVGLGGGYGGEFPLFIAPVGDGRLWLAGTLYGSGIDLGGGVLHSAGHGDVLLAQLDADGEHLWSRRAGDLGHQEFRAIAATPDGGLVIAGGLEGSLDLGAGPVISSGTRDAFVARLDAEGQPIWARGYGDNRTQSSDAVRVGPDGGVLLAGSFESTIDLGGGPFVSPKLVKEGYPENSWYSAIFLAQLTADGTHTWSTALLADNATAWISTLDRGGDGTLVLAGYGESSLLFPDVWGSGSGPWIATLGDDASPRWQRILPDDLWSRPRAVAGPNGAAIVAFTIFGEVELDGATLGTPDRETLILAQFGL